MRLYLAVTADEYELPVYVATKLKEMSLWSGLTVNALDCAISKYHRYKAAGKRFRPHSGYYYCRVEADDDN